MGSCHFIFALKILQPAHSFVGQLSHHEHKQDTEKLSHFCVAYQVAKGVLDEKKTN